VKKSYLCSYEFVYGGIVMPTLLTEMDSSGEYYNAEWKYDEHCVPSNLHCHDYFEIYLCTRGDIVFFVDDRIYNIEPNQLFILPPFLMHGVVERLELFDYERGSLYMSSKALINASFGQIDLEHYLRDMTENGYCFNISEEAAVNFRQLIITANKYCKSETPLDRFSAYTYIAGLMNIICHSVDSGGNLVAAAQDKNINGKNRYNAKKQGDKTDINYDILCYINDNYAEKISIESIAEHFGISTSGLMHMFSDYTGHSVYDYILYRRIMRAKELMYTTVSLNDIAYQCGFNDYSNFLRVFKKQVGESPREYKKKRRI